MSPQLIGELIEEALREFDNASVSTTSHVRRAIRIATKRQDYVALLRLLPETFDLSTGKVDHPAFDEARDNLTALLGKQDADHRGLAAILRHQQGRQFGDGTASKVYGQSIAQLESLLAQINETIDSCSKVPDNLTEIDTYFVARDYDAAIAKLLPMRRELEDVIERVKQAVYDFLIETERQIELGQRRPDIFERGREYVERGLGQWAPEALSTFQAAEESLTSGQPEDLAHALTSCRRMIKALADALYPATGETVIDDDGRAREMTDDAYRNRLLQFATQRVTGSAHVALVKESLRSLGNRLQRLNEISSKGVHDEVSRAEAETCILWTYLTAADFLRIADGSSSLIPKLEP